MFHFARQLRFCSPHRVRSLVSSAPRYARPKVESNNTNVVHALDQSPIVQAVVKRMQRRDELQSQLPDNIQTLEDKARMKRVSELEPLRNAWEVWRSTRQLLEDTIPLLEDPDPTMRSLAANEHAELMSKLSHIVKDTFPALLVPPSETGHLSAMLEMKAGVGGAEASLFLADIMRMYTQLAQSMRWQAVIIANNETENGGIKDAILEVKGENAYDTLRWESGVHRVQRIPATDSSGRVHTSTIAIVVLPLTEDSSSTETGDDLFSMEDVRIEVMRARGAGGQHVNKTESAVRLTHIPTGITVSMQDERSQHQNRRRAFQVLRARLMDRKMTQDVLDRRNARRNLVRSADRSEKIRTYNYAQDRVTDHRLGLSTMNLSSVMQGGEGLRDFLDELGKKHQEELLEEAFETA